MDRVTHMYMYIYYYVTVHCTQDTFGLEPGSWWVPEDTHSNGLHQTTLSRPCESETCQQAKTCFRTPTQAGFATAEAEATGKQYAAEPNRYATQTCSWQAMYREQRFVDMLACQIHEPGKVGGSEVFALVVHYIHLAVVIASIVLNCVTVFTFFLHMVFFSCARWLNGIWQWYFRWTMPHFNSQLLSSMFRNQSLGPECSLLQALPCLCWLIHFFVAQITLSRLQISVSGMEWYCHFVESEVMTSCLRWKLMLHKAWSSLTGHAQIAKAFHSSSPCQGILLIWLCLEIAPLDTLIVWFRSILWSNLSLVHLDQSEPSWGSRLMFQLNVYFRVWSIMTFPQTSDYGTVEK